MATDPAIEPSDEPIRRLLARGPIVVLSGAGLSTASGIPDYRDRNGDWKHARPVHHADFLRSENTRRRYWARSFVGWPTIGQADPTRGHRVLTRFEQSGQVSTVITQNVDGLHQKAGSRSVIELHGGLARVRCLSCQRIAPRTAIQDWMADANPGFAPRDAPVAPDGDAGVSDALHAAFRIPACPSCGGMLKPDVVFFGDSVPKDRVKACIEAINAANGLLVVGSSLMVYSGFRLAEHARLQGKLVMAINLGKTRADEFLDAKIEADCDAFLQQIQLSPTSGGNWTQKSQSM